MTYKLTKNECEVNRSTFINTGLETVRDRLKELYQTVSNKKKIKVRVGQSVNDDDPESDVFPINLYVGELSNSVKSYYAKFYYPTFWEERVQREFDATRLMWKCTRSYAPEISVVRPVLCLPEYRCLVTEAQPNIGTLHQVIKKGRSNFNLIVKVINLYAKWLEVLQNIKTGQHINYSNISMVQGLQDNLRYCQKQGFITNKVALGIISDSERFIIPLQNSYYEEVASQNTVHLSNILISEEGICLLDFGRFCYQSIYVDISNFWYCLNPINPISISEKNGDRLRSTFLNIVRHQFKIDDEILLYFLLNALVGDTKRVVDYGFKNKTWVNSMGRLVLKIAFRYRFYKMKRTIREGF